MWHRGPVSEGFWKPNGTACPNRMGKAVTYAGKAQQNHGVGDGSPLQKHAKQQNPVNPRGGQLWSANMVPKRRDEPDMVEWVEMDWLHDPWNTVGCACETAERQQDSSPRGGQFVYTHGVQTSPSRPLKTKQNHGVGVCGMGASALAGLDFRA